MHIWNITTKKNLLHTVNHLYCSISRRHLTIYYFKTTFIVSSLVGHTSLFSFSQKSTCCPAAWRVISQRWITSAFDSKCLLNLHYFGNQRPNELFLLICSFFSFRLFFCCLTPSMANAKQMVLSSPFTDKDVTGELPSLWLRAHASIHDSICTCCWTFQSFKSVLLSVHQLLILEVDAVGLELPFIFRKRLTILKASFQDKMYIEVKLWNFSQNLAWISCQLC